MANTLIKHCKGKYRLKCHYDLRKKVFPRDPDGKLEGQDVYVWCANGTEITHYGGNIYTCMIPSIGRGHNILKRIYIEKVNNDLSKFEDTAFKYDEMYKEMIDKGVITYITETDIEVLFRFNKEYLYYICDICDARTNGAGISPYSTKNLPKKKIKWNDYEVKDKDTYDLMLGILKEWSLKQGMRIDKAYKKMYSEFGTIVGMDFVAESKKLKYKPLHIIDMNGYTEKLIKWIKEN